jgi:hypothetical protein
VHYQEEFLEKLVQGHKDNQKKAKEVFEARKEAILRDGLDKHLLPEERLAPPPGYEEALSQNVHPAEVTAGEEAGPSTSTSSS